MNFLITLYLLSVFIYMAVMGNRYFRVIELFANRESAHKGKVVVLKHKWFYDFKLFTSGYFYFTIITGLIPIYNVLKIFKALWTEDITHKIVREMKRKKIFKAVETDKNIETLMSELFAELAVNIEKIKEPD